MNVILESTIRPLIGRTTDPSIQEKPTPPSKAMTENVAIRGRAQSPTKNRAVPRGAMAMSSSLPRSRQAATTTTSSSPPVVCSKSIPIGKGIHRTASELQLIEDEAMAEYRDYLMYSRLVNGINPRENPETFNNICKTRQMPVRDVSCSYQEDFNKYAFSPLGSASRIATHYPFQASSPPPLPLEEPEVDFTIGSPVMITEPDGGYDVDDTDDVSSEGVFLMDL